MKKISFLSDFKSNEIFLNLNDEKKNRDNFFCNYYVLRQALLDESIDISTSDINLPHDSDLIVIDELASSTNFTNKKQYLNLMESDIVRSRDFEVSSHQNISKVFTWSDDLVSCDSSKYIKTNYSFCFPASSSIPVGNLRPNLCVMIAGNKGSSFPNELYSERLRAIKWFEKNHPNDFDLYGIDWNKAYIRSALKLLRLPNRFPIFSKIFHTKRPSYRGAIKVKKDILCNYKFSICYENCSSNGYITEKLFDSFFSGCVPIYLGAPNVEKYIPLNCFIDFRDFNNYEDLYVYITSMSDAEYENYQKSIINFLYGPMGYEFSAYKLAETWINVLKVDGFIE